jgi:hypothetical protein
MGKNKRTTNERNQIKGKTIKRPAFAGLSERHLPFPGPSPHYFFVLLPEAGTVDGLSKAS